MNLNRKRWMKGAGIAAFAFFLIKGLLWLSLIWFGVSWFDKC